MVQNHNFLALRPEWILQNDGDKIILYLMSNHESKYVILDPITSVVVPFLNGRQNVRRLVEVIHYIFNLPSEDRARSLLEYIIEALNAKNEIIAILDKPANWVINYNPLDFIISPGDFVQNHRLMKPISLMIYFSSWCQTNCIYCYADLTNMRSLKHLSLQQWFHILRDARELGIRIIQLTGGDPLSRHDSIDFLTHLVEQGFLFMVSTKCYISPKDAKQLVDAGFNEPVNGVNRNFQISIDSSDPVVANYMTGCKGYAERATQTVCNLLEAGISVQVKAVVTPFNYFQVYDHIRTLAGLGVKHFQFSNYSKSYYRHNDNLFLSDEMKAKAADLLNAAAHEWPELTIEGDATKYVPAGQYNQQQRINQWVVRASCSGGRTNLGVAPDGRAVLCEQMPLTIPYFIGDLTRQSILEVWNSPELLNFIFPQREFFARTQCHDCTDFENCIHDRGYCFRDSFFAFAKLHHPPPNCPNLLPGTYRSI